MHHPIIPIFINRKLLALQFKRHLETGILRCDILVGECSSSKSYKGVYLLNNDVTEEVETITN